jgi:DNA-binding MarR family transcriptional regulator
MSRGGDDTRAALLARLTQELRQQSGLGASFFRAAAARVGMPVTDLQVLDMLDSSGLTTAGQLAEASGLTTGAITGMLNRLEEAGLVRRERDPNDGRKVIVRLAPGKEGMGEIHALFAGAGQAWEQLAAIYDDAQLALIVAFLERANALARDNITRLREAPVDEDDVVSAPLGALTQARLVYTSSLSLLHLRVEAGMAELYRARFTGQAPEVKSRDGVVTMRYPKRLFAMGGAKDRQAAVTLSATVPWRIEAQGAGTGLDGDLSGLDLAGLEVKGDASMIHLTLPAPTGMVPLRISGSASEIDLRRPAGVPVRAHLKGWASTFTFDDQTFSDLGNDVRLQSPGYEASAPGYDIEVSSSASTVAITTV